jgi:predicted transcriptional regulator YdeE
MVMELDEMVLHGLSLNKKTSNTNGQSAHDCGSLWQKFASENCFNLITNKMSEQIFAVYHEYEGDHTGQFGYFIGCKVSKESEVPEGLKKLVVTKGNFMKFVAKGTIPNCISETWKTIWASEIKRAYQADFEVYDERSANWNDAEVDVFVSILE